MRDPKPGPTKGGTSRTVDVSAELGLLFDTLKADRTRDAMRRAWRPVPPWMFVTSNGTLFSHGCVRDDFLRVLKRAGLGHRDFTPHSMRHLRRPPHPQRLLGEVGPTADGPLEHRHHPGRLREVVPLHDHAGADELSGQLLGNAVGNTAG